MSVELMSLVWRTDLPPTHKLLLLSLADHASDSGQHIHPSIALTCARTGLSERTVRANLRQLEAAGILSDTGERTAHGIHIYSLNPHRLRQEGGGSKCPPSRPRGAADAPGGAADAPGGAADAPPTISETSDNHQGNDRGVQRAAAVWQAAQAELRNVLTPGIWQTYIQPVTAVGYSTDDGLLLDCPNAQVAEWLQQRLAKPIRRALAGAPFLALWTPAGAP